MATKHIRSSGCVHTQLEPEGQGHIPPPHLITRDRRQVLCEMRLQLNTYPRSARPGMKAEGNPHHPLITSLPHLHQSYCHITTAPPPPHGGVPVDGPSRTRAPLSPQQQGPGPLWLSQEHGATAAAHLTHNKSMTRRLTSQVPP